MNLIINCAIDDCNPLKGYRILGEKPEQWLRELNEKFGAKFDLFCPSNFHNQAPLSENKEWIVELASIDYFSLNAHGHFHQTSNPKQLGECEFFEIRSADEALERVKLIYHEWNECGLGFEKFGWRSPGWLCSEGSKHVLEKNFKYAAIHYEHNRLMNWNCKTFFGHDGIQQENIGIHNVSEDGETGMIMFQSHIYGNHNHNVWNESNFEQLCQSLDYLTTNFNCTFKNLSECI